MTKRRDRTGMSKRLTRTGNSLALVIDRPVLEALAIDADTELALSANQVRVYGGANGFRILAPLRIIRSWMGTGGWL